MEYAVPLDPELEDRALEQIAKTENIGERPAQSSEMVGKRVLHPVFGEGSVIGTPRGQEGVIVQFDTVVTPRTFGPTAKLVYL